MSQGYAVVICVVLALFLVKSIGSVLLANSILKLLSGNYEKCSDKFLRAYFDMHLHEIKSKPTYEVFMSVNTGVKDIFVIGLFSYINFLLEICVISVIFIFVLAKGGFPVIVLTLLFILIFFITNNFASRSTEESSKKNADSNLIGATSIQTLIESIREIKLFGSFEDFKKVHNDSVRKSAEATIALQTTALIPKVVLESSFMCGVALFTLWSILFGDLSKAVFSITFIVALGSRMIPSLLRLQTAFNSIKQVIGAAVFSFNLIENESFVSKLNVSNPEDSKKFESERFTPSIALENVTFGYPRTDTKAIVNLNLKIEAGQSLGIVGSSGSGKSTLIDILLGFADPDQGSCKISGFPSKQAVKSWGAKIGYVPQSIALIDGTIRENILLGRDCKKFNDQDFERAIAFAGIDDFIGSLERKLEHPLTRSGSELSGGQRQKLGIARAVLGSPEILILDESTSSLDTESENIIAQAINNYLGRVTLIIISHRLNLVRNLDRIALMVEGQLAALDTFENLERESAIFNKFIQLSRI